jgi:hypothetical protein
MREHTKTSTASIRKLRKAHGSETVEEDEKACMLPLAASRENTVISDTAVKQS